MRSAPPGSASTPPSSAPRRLRSTSSVGRASRNASSGIRLWPPASTFASSPASPRRATASSTLAGAVCSSGGGFSSAPLVLGVAALEEGGDPLVVVVGAAQHRVRLALDLHGGAQVGVHPVVERRLQRRQGDRQPRAELAGDAQGCSLQPFGAGHFASQPAC